MSESPVPAGTERVDHDVLKIPRLEGTATRPLYEDRRMTGVITELGQHALCLQDFRASHDPVRDTVRPQIIETVRSRGGSAEEGWNRLGPEARVRSSPAEGGRRATQPTMVVGCDGPGWLLRGLYCRPEALAAPMDPRVYHLFMPEIVPTRSSGGLR